MDLNKNNKYQLIDDYLQGNMSIDDMDRFKAFMQTDNEISDNFQIIQELQESHDFNKASQDLNNTLLSIRNADVNQAPIQRKSKIAWFSLLLAIIIGGLFYFTNAMSSDKESRNKIIHQYALVEPLSLSTKSNDLQQSLLDIENLYNNKNYKQALPLISVYLEEKPRDLDILLAYGISLSEESEYIKANEIFSTIKSLKPRVKKHLWYAAINNLRAGKDELATSQLTTIVKEKSYKYLEAKELIQELMKE